MWCGKDSKRGNRIVSPTSELRIEREDGVAAALAEIDPQRVGLWGISLGGWVAPLASVLSQRPAFLVLLSSCGVHSRR
jgi:hypothetical protein